MEIKKLIVLITCVAYGVWGYPKNYFETVSKSIRGGRIVGGSDAVQGQFPFQCAIYIFTSNGTNFCSGSIISEKFALSAAHCFLNMMSGLIIAGIIDLQDENPPYDFDIEPESVISHEKYDPLDYIHDIALIDVSDNPFEFSTPNIMKIQLSSLAFDVLVGQQARIAGWGKTKDGTDEISNVLYYIDAKVLNKDSCKAVYGSKITAEHLCLSGENGQSTCGGDSGGGLTIKNHDSRVLIGIVSFGAENGCQQGYPTVMTFTTAYIDWIYNNTKNSLK